MWEVPGVSNVQFEVRDQVGWGTLNRPERLNAIGRTTIDDLQAVLDDTRGARCLVVTGAGCAFSAGADVKEWYEGTEGEGLGWVPTCTP